MLGSLLKYTNAERNVLDAYRDEGLGWFAFTFIAGLSGFAQGKHKQTDVRTTAGETTTFAQVTGDGYHAVLPETLLGMTRHR